MLYIIKEDCVPVGQKPITRNIILISSVVSIKHRLEQCIWNCIIINLINILMLISIGWVLSFILSLYCISFTMRRLYKDCFTIRYSFKVPKCTIYLLIFFRYTWRCKTYTRCTQRLSPVFNVVNIFDNNDTIIGEKKKSDL